MSVGKVGKSGLKKLTDHIFSRDVDEEGRVRNILNGKHAKKVSVVRVDMVLVVHKVQWD